MKKTEIILRIGWSKKDFGGRQPHLSRKSGPYQNQSTHSSRTKQDPADLNQLRLFDALTPLHLH